VKKNFAVFWATYDTSSAVDRYRCTTDPAISTIYNNPFLENEKVAVRGRVGKS
jgi:hypothetical protein